MTDASTGPSSNEKLAMFKRLQRGTDLSHCGHCSNRIEKAPGVWAMWFEGSGINDAFSRNFDHLMFDYYWFSMQPYDFGGAKSSQLLELRAISKACGVRLYDITPGSHAEGTICLIFVIENIALFKAIIGVALEHHRRYDSFARLGRAAQVSFDKGGVRRSLQKSYSSIPDAPEIYVSAIGKLWPKGFPVKGASE